MDTVRLETAYTIPQSGLSSLVSMLTGANPNPDDPHPPGPWDPVIRRAAERIAVFAAQGAVGPYAAAIAGRVNAVALNPQPLPPRFALAIAVAREVIERTILLYELAEAFPSEVRGYVQGAAGGHLVHFVDDICGNDIRYWPVPVPPPGGGDGAPVVITGAELIVMGVQFVEASAWVGDESLRGDVAGAGRTLIETGLSRL